jgi:hypothetical protein
MAEEAVVTHFKVSRKFMKIHKALHYCQPSGLNSNKVRAISDSHADEYENDSLLEHCAVYIIRAGSVRQDMVCPNVIYLVTGIMDLSMKTVHTSETSVNFN